MLVVNNFLSVGYFSQVHTNRFDALAEMPVVSTISSAVRLPYGVLSWLWEVMRSPFLRGEERDQSIIKRDVAVVNMKRSIVDWIPILGNYFAVQRNTQDIIRALKSTYCQQLVLDFVSLQKTEREKEIIVAEFQFRCASLASCTDVDLNFLLARIQQGIFQNTPMDTRRSEIEQILKDREAAKLKAFCDPNRFSYVRFSSW